MHSGDAAEGERRFFQVDVNLPRLSEVTEPIRGPSISQSPAGSRRRPSFQVLRLEASTRKVTGSVTFLA